MAADALIIDLDGTVWDSYPWYALVLAQSSGVARQRIEADLRSGGNIVGLIRDLRVSRAAFSSSSREVMSRLALYPGVATTLDELVRRRRRLAAVTNLPAWLVTPMLEGTAIADRFDVVKTAAGKPRPSGVLGAAAALGVRPSERVVLVGDGEGDRAAARASGMSFAWVSYGYGPGPAPGDIALRSFADVLRL